MPFDKETQEPNHPGKFSRTVWQNVALCLGPLGAILVFSLLGLYSIPDDERAVVALIIWMGSWWMSEAVPLPVTALLPILYLPSMGLESTEEVAANYAHPLFFLFLGSYLIAAAMQNCGLHKRIALNIVSCFGTRPAQVIAGFMIATALLSMWISNTATTLMMYVVAVAVIELSDASSDKSGINAKFSAALLLSIAYAASIGGVGTLIGTPPNMLFAGVMAKAHGVEVGFFSWMLLGLPVVVIMLPIAWVVLTRIAFKLPDREIDSLAQVVRLELNNLGQMTNKEKAVSGVFLVTIICWLFREALANTMGFPLTDTMIVLTAATALFTIPLTRRFDDFMLDWTAVQYIPLGLILIFGGGLALASAISTSGLSQSIGDFVSNFGFLGVSLTILIAIITMIALTEFTSNTASAATFIPIFGVVAIGLGLEPYELAVPAALGASMAFMLPVATPPNMIIYTDDRVVVADMMRAGSWLNFFAILICFIVVYMLADFVFADA